MVHQNVPYKNKNILGLGWASKSLPLKRWKPLLQTSPPHGLHVSNFF